MCSILESFRIYRAYNKIFAIVEPICNCLLLHLVMGQSHASQEVSNYIYGQLTVCLIQVIGYTCMPS